MTETPVPEPLATFIREWCHPNLFGAAWEYDVALYFDKNPGKGMLVRKQLEEAIAKPYISIPQMKEMISKTFRDQAHIQEYLEMLRSRLDESDQLDLD